MSRRANWITQKALNVHAPERGEHGTKSETTAGLAALKTHFKFGKKRCHGQGREADPSGQQECGANFGSGGEASPASRRQAHGGEAQSQRPLNTRPRKTRKANNDPSGQEEDEGHPHGRGENNDPFGRHIPNCRAEEQH